MNFRSGDVSPPLPQVRSLHEFLFAVAADRTVQFARNMAAYSSSISAPVIRSACTSCARNNGESSAQGGSAE